MAKRGLWLKRVDNEVLIIGVIGNTPASRAGIVSGSKLKRINGKKAEDMSYKDIVGELHKDKVKMVVRKEGKSAVIHLETKPNTDENLGKEKWKADERR